MAAEQQLERSVLERKEREELRAIADAMALDTNSRSKKADIIDQILRAAGVDATGADSSNGSTPARPRTRAGSARAAASVDAELTTETTPTNGDSAEHSHANGTAPAPTASNGRSESSESSGSSEVSETSEASGASADAAGESDGTTVTQADRPAPARQGSSGQGGPGQNRQQGQAPQHAQSGGNPNDPANRRGRRRRGRERTGPGGGPSGGGERELQGGGQEAQYQGELVPVSGLLDLRDEGYGFVRAEGYLPSARDVYVSISQARRFALRKGDYIEGASRPAASNEKFPALIRIDTVSGLSPDDARGRPRFEDLTPLFPDSKLRLETPGAAEITTRIIDLLSPIGKGQRGMIVSPPKAGKTTVMKQIAHSIEANNPEVHLIVLLVDERPEEVTDMRRSVKGEVVASTFDRPSDEHTAIAELTIDHAKRLVEVGRDVVIILDGITRLARAYNLAQPASGRIMSGGVDSGALYPPKRFFGAARNIEEGGSLTILATALVETGSKMDEVIFEEFKGTGNMELRLDRRLAERRLYPSIDVNASSTRHEELLFERGQLQQVWKLRRVLNALAADGNAAAGLELLMDKIRTTKSNDEFLAEIAKGPAT
ncbi:MAG TPA: transcription termination factor Rho [Acidimicrobiales bacterium]|nr:transcription termination factor Rho [Acidimicrobiales bacterium]